MHTKIFIVGPHNPERYDIIGRYIRRVHQESPAKQEHLMVINPTDNPRADRFNDWIFGQIDTCDLLVVDVSNFNPNVIYETAFAHSIGTPCVYISFPEDKTDSSSRELIKHYFKSALIIYTNEDELNRDGNREFRRFLLEFFLGSPLSGETILSDYYGTFPSEAQFMRALAEGYFRNLLGPVLRGSSPDEHSHTKLIIAIPDTFQTNDADLDAVIKDKLPSNQVRFAKNALGRELGINFCGDLGIFFDVPTTMLTVTQSSKYNKIKNHFSKEELDKITDRMARRFVDGLWSIIVPQQSALGLVNRLRFVWLSEIIGVWHENPRLMNYVPFDAPEGYRRGR